MSKDFFQESIDEAIALLEESNNISDLSLQRSKRKTAYDLIEKLSGFLAGLKGREEGEFLALVNRTKLLLGFIQNYEIARDKQLIAAKMRPLVRDIVKKVESIVSLTVPGELESLPSKTHLERMLDSMRNTSSEQKIKEITIKHFFQNWKEREAQEFALLINYLDNYLRYLKNANLEMAKDNKKSLAAAIVNLRKAKIFGVLVVKQARKMAELL